MATAVGAPVLPADMAFLAVVLQADLRLLPAQIKPAARAPRRRGPEVPPGRRSPASWSAGAAGKSAATPGQGGERHQFPRLPHAAEPRVPVEFPGQRLRRADICGERGVEHGKASMPGRGRARSMAVRSQWWQARRTEPNDVAAVRASSWPEGGSTGACLARRDEKVGDHVVEQTETMQLGGRCGTGRYLPPMLSRAAESRSLGLGSAALRRRCP